MSEFKKNIGKLIVYWTPEDDAGRYTFSISYLDDFFVKGQILNRQDSKFPISYIPGNDPKGKYTGILFINLSDNSLNISLESPQKVEEKLYPQSIDPDKPSHNRQNYIMNIEKLSYKELFPYIYIQPWPNTSKKDIEKNFAFCCIDTSANSVKDYTSCKNLNNDFYNELVKLKSQNDRPGMETQSVYYINGYNDKKEPVYKNKYKPDVSSLNSFFKNVLLFGKNLREKETVTFKVLTEEVNQYFDSWQSLENDLKEQANKDEQVKIIMSYIALMITFGYNFSWMIDLQIIIITLNLFYKALLCVDNNEPQNEEEDNDDVDSRVPTPETIHSWIYSTVILPGDIFPLPVIKTDSEEENSDIKKAFVEPYSLGKLKMVKYRLHNYRLGEVNKIESILKGETKTVEERELNRYEEETSISQEEVITWHEALNESFAGLQYSNDKTLKQRTGTTTYNNGTGNTIGGWTVDENPAGGSNRNENTFAKDIINKAAEIITRKVDYHRAQKNLHEYEEKIVHQYDNLNGEEDIIGIYRWISKIYKFQAVECGNRVMLQIYCADPAENYLKNESQFYRTNNEYTQDHFHLDEIKTLKELGINTFEDISASPQENNKKYYLDILEHYDISRFPSPPGISYNIEKTIEGYLQTEYSIVIIPLEYKPVNAAVTITLTEKSSSVTVKIGGQEKTINESSTVDYELTEADLNGNQLPVYINAVNKEGEQDDGVSTENTGDGNNKLLYTTRLNVTAQIKENILNEWKYKIFILLKQGYKQKLKNYYRLVYYRNQALSSGNFELTRNIILQQLKKKCVGVIKRHYTKIINGSLIKINDTDKTDVHNLLTGEPAFLQFIEHGLEWDKLTYYLYPEFENEALYKNNTTEQNFNSFLRSKFARILLPIKIDYQYSFLFSLLTGWLWTGNDADSPALLGNINIFNQLKNLCPEKKEDAKESWEISIPTSLTILQKGSDLPEFSGDENE